MPKKCAHNHQKVKHRYILKVLGSILIDKEPWREWNMKTIGKTHCYKHFKVNAQLLKKVEPTETAKKNLKESTKLNMKRTEEPLSLLLLEKSCQCVM